MPFETKKWQKTVKKARRFSAKKDRFANCLPIVWITHLTFQSISYLTPYTNLFNYYLGWKFPGKPIFFLKILFTMGQPLKGKADNWQICLFFCGKAPRFFHRVLSFFRLEWHLGGWKFQGKPEILFQKYVLVWPNPRKCQGRQIIGKSVFFCGTVLPFGRHFLDSNST